MSLPGSRILPNAPMAPAELVEAFAQVVTPHISDNLGRHIGARGLTRYNRSGKLVGTAITVKTRPGDNLLIYKALMQAEPGQVLVVDGAGDTTNALVGELIMLYAQQRGMVGFVIDGAVRDTAAFIEADFPCYARDVSHRGPYKQGPGQIGVPVSIGGQVVRNGDWVVGDEDGVVTFSAEEASALIEAAHRTAAAEEAIKREIATGEYQQSWLDKVLKPAGL